MRKKKTVKRSFQDLNFDDLKWCIDNDYQVYLVPLTRKVNNFTYTTGEFKVAVRRKGITTEGLDKKMVNGRYIKSKETLSELTFASQSEAEAHLNYVYKHLRTKYG